MKPPALILAALALAATALTACARTPPPATMQTGPTAVAVAPQPATPIASADVEPIPASPTLARMVVHKSASCGCCSLWVDHMRNAGFEVEVRDSDNFHPVKERLGVPLGKGSCHTAEVDGYFIEGHIPAEDVKRLLAEKPDAKGLVLPGMPAGSPGMEMPDGRVQPYIVEMVGNDGGTQPYASHGP